MFDRKMLIFMMVLLLGLASIDFILPDLANVFGLQFLIYFLALATMMVLMRYLGLIEGLEEGFKKGLHEAEKPFVFLPHGGND